MGPSIPYLTFEALFWFSGEIIIQYITQQPQIKDENVDLMNVETNFGERFLMNNLRTRLFNDITDDKP